jgi:hypothetical protein
MAQPTRDMVVSAIEGIGIPGIVSILGLLLYYIPTYFLWMTGFFFLMLITKKIGSKEYVSHSSAVSLSG